MVESAVGAHLWAHADPDELSYWREGNAEVDWVVRPGKLLRGASRPVALEVKTGAARGTPGLSAFAHAHGARALVIGAGGIPLEAFLAGHPAEWLDG